MTCVISNNSNIRNLFIECQATILDQFAIPDLYRETINTISYIIIPVDATDYTRTITDRSDIVDSYRGQFVTPKIARVGFTARVFNNLWCIRRCLEYLAISSISTSYDTTIPVSVIDYVRPEVTDTVYTIRQGSLGLSAGNGTSGSGESQEPLYTTDYEIEFREFNKRLIM